MKTRYLTLMILVLSTALGSTARRAVALEAKLIDFKIKDQFDQEYVDEDFLGEIVCLIGSDKDGSEYNRLWGPAIEDSLAADPGENTVRFLKVAHMKGVPFFLKGFVKGKFPKDEENWVLLDWKGKFSKAYTFAPGESNIIVFDREGTRIVRAHGKEPTDEKLAIVLEALRKLLAEG